MAETPKTIYRRAWYELINAKNLDIVDELFAFNYVRHDPHYPMRGRDALRQFASVLHHSLSDIRFTIDDLVEEGEKIVKRFTLTCTHTGNLMGSQATGKRLTLTGLTLGRIADRYIVEEWNGTDWLSWQQQLRLISNRTST